MDNSYNNYISSKNQILVQMLQYQKKCYIIFCIYLTTFPSF